ncbi:OprO/OprP family phosphate-selective porin [Muricoccus radiodurans]|uniref:OprO/OprP family phosphate-selective porin n=1 Tax=Muricoccus radiodurans TaxID=2231721 RepID=UPI003CEC6DF9
MRPLLLAALSLLGAAPAVAQDDGAEADGVRITATGLPEWRALDGGFTLRPLVRLDADAGSFFGQDEPGGFRSGVNLRRGRLGLRGTVARDFSYNVTWEFGGSNPADYANIYEAQIAYHGLGWGTVRAGAFTPQHLPEYAGSSFDLLFLERAAISNLAAGLASGDTRVAIGLEARGDRWVASGYGTQGVLSTRNDPRQRGLVGRVAGLVLAEESAALQIGFDAAYQFEPGSSPGPNSVGLADYPELRVDTRRFLNTRAIPADSGFAWGPEIAGRLGPVYVEALYQRIEVDAVVGGSRTFEGYYVQAAVPLFSPARRRDRETGTWARPRTEGGFAPAEGRWGAFELAARYSVADLQDGPTRGGRQRIWTIGLNWFPTGPLRFQVQYETGRIGLDGPDRDFQAIGLRASANL